MCERADAHDHDEAHRVHIVPPATGAPLALTCSHCRHPLGRPCYECLTCKPGALYVLCQRCEEALDADDSWLVETMDFHDVNHVFAKHV